MTPSPLRPSGHEWMNGGRLSGWRRDLGQGRPVLQPAQVNLSRAVLGRTLYSAPSTIDRVFSPCCCNAPLNVVQCTYPTPCPRWQWNFYFCKRIFKRPFYTFKGIKDSVRMCSPKEESSFFCDNCELRNKASNGFLCKIYWLRGHSIKWPLSNKMGTWIK